MRVMCAIMHHMQLSKKSPVFLWYKIWRKAGFFCCIFRQKRLPDGEGDISSGCLPEKMLFLRIYIRKFRKNTLSDLLFE